jgi:transposase
VASQPRTHLLFADEAWWGLTTEVRRVWARGPRPTQPIWRGRSWTPVIGAAEPATGRFLSIVAGRLDAAWFGLFLALLAAEYAGERVVLVVDRAGWHTARSLAVPANVILWFLPPHSPELNPVEQVWGWLRGRSTRGRLFTALDRLVDELCVALNALADDPARVRSLTDQSWLYAQPSP